MEGREAETDSPSTARRNVVSSPWIGRLGTITHSSEFQLDTHTPMWRNFQLPPLSTATKLVIKQLRKKAIPILLEKKFRDAPYPSPEVFHEWAASLVDFLAGHPYHDNIISSVKSELMRAWRAKRDALRRRLPTLSLSLKLPGKIDENYINSHLSFIIPRISIPPRQLSESRISEYTPTVQEEEFWKRELELFFKLRSRTKEDNLEICSHSVTFPREAVRLLDKLTLAPLLGIHPEEERQAEESQQEEGHLVDSPRKGTEDRSEESKDSESESEEVETKQKEDEEKRKEELRMRREKSKEEERKRKEEEEKRKREESRRKREEEDSMRRRKKRGENQSHSLPNYQSRTSSTSVPASAGLEERVLLRKKKKQLKALYEEKVGRKPGVHRTEEELREALRRARERLERGREEEELTVDRIEDWGVKELAEQCKKRGLDYRGNKRKLMKRLKTLLHSSAQTS